MTVSRRPWSDRRPPPPERASTSALLVGPVPVPVEIGAGLRLAITLALAANADAEEEVEQHHGERDAEKRTAGLERGVAVVREHEYRGARDRDGNRNHIADSGKHPRASPRVPAAARSLAPARRTERTEATAVLNAH